MTGLEPRLLYQLRHNHCQKNIRVSIGGKDKKWAATLSKVNGVHYDAVTKDQFYKIIFAVIELP